MDYVIRPWSPPDSAVLKTMIARFLAAGVERGGDIIPTERSIDYLLDLGLCFAANGGPSYVAEAGAGLLGYIEWGELPVPMDQRWRTCHTFGSFVFPGARHRGVARALRYAARDRCIELGIERIIGPVHMTNGDGIAEFVRQGAWPTSMQMELHLWP